MARTSPPEKPRVLIVDDNRDAADVLAMLLELENYEVATAYGGAEGLECAQRFRPQLVLLDLDMPGMDGLCAAGVLKADRRRMLLVALSAKCGPDREQELRDAGFDMQISKPAECKQLLGSLEGLLAPGRNTH